MGLIQSLGQKNITTVVVLHDLNLAAQYCSRLVLMKGGELLYNGNPTRVLTPDTIRDVFNVNAIVSTHPLAGTPLVTITGNCDYEKDAVA